MTTKLPDDTPLALNLESEGIAMRASTTEALQRFLLNRRSQGRQPLTVADYERRVGLFFWWMRGQGVTELQAITADHIRLYLLYRQKAGKKKPTLYLDGAKIRAFVRWACDEGLMNEKVALKLHVPKQPDSLIEAFSMEQIEALLLAARRTRMPKRNVAILLLMADTGCRASELCGLRDSDLQKDRVRILGKRSKWRWAPISELTYQAVEVWRAARSENAEQLFVTSSGRPLYRGLLLQLFYMLGKKARLSGVRCSPHTMRHSAALAWVRTGGDVFALQKLLGHTTLDMVRRYVSLLFEDVAKAHRTHGIGNLLAASQ